MHDIDALMEKMHAFSFCSSYLVELSLELKKFPAQRCQTGILLNVFIWLSWQILQTLLIQLKHCIVLTCNSKILVNDPPFISLGDLALTLMMVQQRVDFLKP